MLGLTVFSHSCWGIYVVDGDCCLQIDSVIGQAQEAFNALRFQRSTFGDISTKISTVGMKLPLVCKTLPPKFGFFWLLFPHKLNCCNMSRTACPNL
jgi:hypothetical protein